MGTSAYVSPKKKFGNKYYKYRMQFSNKKYAENSAEGWRDKGHKARVVKGTHPGYGKNNRVKVYRVYTRYRR